MRLSRRGFAASLSTAAVASLAVPALGQKRDFSPGASPVRYPDPDLVKLDDRFAKYMIGNTPIQRLHTGCLWAEGPAWSSVGRYLLWSDIPNNRILRWCEESESVSVFRHPSDFCNGNTRDRQGRLISCEHASRRGAAWAATWSGVISPTTGICAMPMRTAISASCVSRWATPTATPSITRAA